MTKDELLLEQWKLASELQRHEDNLSWQKFGYGVAINGALLGALTVSPETATAAFRPLVPLFAIIVSTVWHLMQVRVAAYQRLRIRQAQAAEADLKVDGTCVLNVYRGKLPPANFFYRLGAQQLMSWLPVLFIVAWALVFWFVLREPSVKPA